MPVFRLWLFMTLLLGLACQPAAEEARSPRPNILFAIADDASYPHFGVNGCEWVNTPAFDRVANEGLNFRRAYTPNAKCAPSRSCIVTGRNSWQLEEAANHWAYFPIKFTTYAEALQAQGYATGFTGKGWAPGVALDAAGNRRELVGPRFSQLKTEPPTSAISDNDYAANFAAFLDQKPAAEPFCFWYGAIEPHRAYEYGSGPRLTGRSPDEIEEVPPYWPDNDTVRTDLLDYAYEIQYFDQHLGRMLAELEKRGLLENTLVVVTSDNGMPFPRGKANSYEVSHHMPLAIMWPQGISNPGRVVDEMVSFIDFAPTFLAVAGLDPEKSGMQPITGFSLTPLLKQQEIRWPRDFLLLGKERHDVGRPGDVGYPIRSILQDSLLYIHNFEPDRWPAGNPQTGYLATDGGATKTSVLDSRVKQPPSSYWELCFGKRPQQELYDLRQDPHCVRNLASEPGHTETVSRLREQLFAALKAEGDPRMQPGPPPFDGYLYSNEADRRFYERYLAGEDVSAGWVNPSDFEPDFPER